MTIYCNINPGLLVLNELQPHQVNEARQVLDSLAIHRQNIINYRIQIPITNEYLLHIIESLSLIKIQEPPIEGPLKELLWEFLNRTMNPALPRANITDANIAPDICPPWISRETRLLWLDCLISALFQKYTEEGFDGIQASNVIATFALDELIRKTKIISQEFNRILDTEQEIVLPTLATNVEWAGYISLLESWPSGIDRSRIEFYGLYHLNIPLGEISNHRQISFEPSCAHDIAQEKNVELRDAIIDTIASRAYDRLRPEHGDEKIKSQSGVRRIYVKKMTPPVRLHYSFDGESIVFNLYSNGKHDKGLK